MRKLSTVILLIAANVAAYFIQLKVGDSFETAFALWPLGRAGDSNFHIWQLETYAFLHDRSNVFHLIFNMIGLLSFGTAIERAVGPARMLACYFASVTTAALTQLMVPMLLGTPPAVTLGASGGVFGLLLAYALMFPHQKVVPLIPPIPMPAWLFATIFAVLELFLGVTGRLSGIAHFAHLGGMIGSALVVFSWRRRARGR